MTTSESSSWASINETHNPDLRSWVTGSDCPEKGFSIQNLPFSVFRGAPDEPWRVGVAIGDQVLDFAALARTGLLDGRAQAACLAGLADCLNGLMALGSDHWSALRLSLSRLLRMGAAHADRASQCLVPMEQAEFRMPVAIGDYTDFYTSIYHAENGGRMRRPEAPLTPNYVWVPIGYHGRVSSIGISGQRVFRPKGQLGPGSDNMPRFSPCEKLDFELELAVYMGTGNGQGTSIGVDAAERHIFGISLLNDWSARDIQFWESAPLGPFLAKNFASTVSPWVVTWEALQPFRAEASRPAGSPRPLPYLFSERDRRMGGLDIQLSVSIQSQRMRQHGLAPETLAVTNARHAFWTIPQLVAHHTSNGCNLRTGDMLGTGTLSGPTEDSLGCLFEMTRDGRHSVSLPGGENRTYLEDFDSITIEGRCGSEHYAAIGFGSCTAMVWPAPHGGG